jgi:TetR/AcrR family transcriptional regulator, transcriptional repressor for nem operon
MARPKEFDVDTALEHAIGVFWHQGFEATSMQDLTDAMGIQRASLYATFGDKRSLYLEALKRYQARSLREMEQRLDQAPSALAAVCDLLRGTGEQACSRQGKRGCFCVNANVELAPHDAAIGDQLRHHSEQVEAVIERALRRAKADGELGKGADCKQLASFLFGVILAINVLARQRASRSRVQALVDQAIASLPS